MHLIKLVVYRYLILLVVPLFVIASCNRNDTRYKGESQGIGLADSSSSDSTLYNTAANHPIKIVMYNMVEDMKDMQTMGSPDKDFAQVMIRHHQGVVEMADVELSNGKDSEIKKIAQQIKDSQRKEFEELNMFIHLNNQKEKQGSGQPPQHTITSMQNSNPNQDANKERTPLTEMLAFNEQLVMKAEELNLSTNFDEDFTKLMIMHHQSAIDIANVEVAKGKDDKIKEMAKMMIKQNKDDINKLNKLLDK
ncbi:MAG TPA: DUF305 domain-containing protein [Ignavibacteriaceae bacterium]|nr:DUF305 domain-containing protein [Ignavibacteriaceae bacterium]